MDSTQHLIRRLLEVIFTLLVVLIENVQKMLLIVLETKTLEFFKKQLYKSRELLVQTTELKQNPFHSTHSDL